MTPRRDVASPLFVLLCLASSLGSAPRPATAQPLEFRHLQTDDLRVVYMFRDHEYLLPHLARCFENSLDFHKQLFDYAPNEQITVLLQDFDDYGYAGATSMPVNYLTIGIEPFEYVYETSPTNERINWVMSHELLHVVASDRAAPADRFWRNFFLGKVGATDEAPLSMLYSYLTTPRLYAPRWYHEGMAVFMETWMAGGIGRALGGYDEMVFRTMVNDDAYFYDTVGLESEGKTIDFQVGQISYLYGTRFVSYLAYQYGPEQLLAWLKRGEGTAASFSAQFERVYGTRLGEEWRRWILWEHEWQRANVERVREYPVTTFEPLSERPLGSASRAYFDPARRQLITAVNFPGKFAHIAAVNVDTWEVSRIAEVTTPALYYVSSLAYDAEAGTVFFTTDNSREWRDLNAVDLKTRKTRLLLQNIRTGDLVLNPADKSIWGVRHHNGLSTLVRIESPYDDWSRIRDVWVLPYGKDLFDIDVSPDGQLLTGAMSEVSGRQQLVSFRIPELLEGKQEPEMLHEFPGYSPANFVFSPDGRYLYGTSYYTGVSNVFRYDLNTREMAALTNALTGFFRPVPVSDRELLAFHYTAQGFRPVRLEVSPIADINPIEFLGQAIVERHPVVKEWNVGSPAEIDLLARKRKEGRYGGVRNLQLASGYPIFEDYRGDPAYGMRLNLMEPAGLSSLDLSASYAPGAESDERVHFWSRFRHWPWDMTGTYNRADFYDFFGPTKSSRKGYSLSVGYSGILIADRPRRMDYELRVAGFGDLDTLPDNQEIPTDVDELYRASARLTYESSRKSIGGLEPEKGIRFELSALDQYVVADVDSDHFPRLWMDFDYGFPVPIEHSSVWVRASAGYSRGGPEEEFANFYFGAFGNNWVDHGTVRRFRDYYSFPGLEIDELPGRDYGRAVLEWQLPPVRFRRVGRPSLYVNYASVALFAGGIVTEIGDSALQREVGDVGLQVDFKLVLFSNLSTTLSLGYAQAFEDGRGTSDEFMVSLKIL